MFDDYKYIKKMETFGVMSGLPLRRHARLSPRRLAWPPFAVMTGFPLGVLPGPPLPSCPLAPSLSPAMDPEPVEGCSLRRDSCHSEDLRGRENPTRARSAGKRRRPERRCRRSAGKCPRSVKTLQTRDAVAHKTLFRVPSLRHFYRPATLLLQTWHATGN